MIALASDCLVFRLASGENVPFSSDMISVELMGETSKWFDAEFVHHAAKSVFHYFKHELGRQTVTVAEFAELLEKVLHGFANMGSPPAAPPPTVPPAPPPLVAPAPPPRTAEVLELDLSRLARESGDGSELFFYPLLRKQFQEQVRQSPRVLRYRGLRLCVKQLVGARRWSERCRTVEAQIISYLRECLSAETGARQVALMVE